MSEDRTMEDESIRRPRLGLLLLEGRALVSPEPLPVTTFAATRFVSFAVAYTKTGLTLTLLRRSPDPDGLREKP